MARETRDTVITETVVTNPLLAADECCKNLGCSKPTFWRWVSFELHAEAREARQVQPVAAI